MVRLLTVVLFPLIAVLAITAPEVIPWMFGPQWSEAVVPTQILCGAGAATLVIDAVGTTLMTGLWQVSGRSELGLEEMIALDVEYACTRSLWVNVKILARTVPVVFAGRGAA